MGECEVPVGERGERDRRAARLGHEDRDLLDRDPVVGRVLDGVVVDGGLGAHGSDPAIDTAIRFPA